MVPMVRESQRKIRKSEKGREFYIPKSGKYKRVRESEGKSKYQGAKVNKDTEKSLNCFTQTVYNSSQVFSAHFARRLFISMLLNLFRRLCF